MNSEGGIWCTVIVLPLQHMVSSQAALLLAGKEDGCAVKAVD